MTHFTVLDSDGAVQTANMVLPCGSESGPLGNEHPDSAQTIVIVSGEVDAQIGERAFRMRAGDCSIVPKGVVHRFVGASRENAQAVCVYSPPAYDAQGYPTGRLRLDRSGEPFADSFTENTGAARSDIERAQHELAVDD